MVQPRVLSATAVMLWTREEVGQMLLVGNRVLRQILGEQGYTPVAALQGEIGASNVGGKDMKIKITFPQYMFRTRTGLLKGVFRKMIDEIKLKRWMKKLGEHMGELRINFSHLKTMSGEEIGGAVNRWEEER